jgi:hypothetical protein
MPGAALKIAQPTLKERVNAKLQLRFKVTRILFGLYCGSRCCQAMFSAEENFWSILTTRRGHTLLFGCSKRKFGDITTNFTTFCVSLLELVRTAAVIRILETIFCRRNLGINSRQYALSVRRLCFVS